MLETINAALPLRDLIDKHPAVKEIMNELGFHDILKLGMLQSVGRFMTIEKGARMKNIEWALIEETFKKHGYLLSTH